MSDSGDKSWDKPNLHLIYTSLSNVDSVLNGNLKSLVRGSEFKLMKEYVDGSQYHGWTEGNGIEFYTLGNAAIRQMNIYHEIGHLIDNALKDVFEQAVIDEGSPSWVDGNLGIDSDALKSLYPSDPNWGHAQARQTYRDFGPSEQWAGAFANYVAGNINLSKPNGPGVEMYNFVNDTLATYINGP